MNDPTPPPPAIEIIAFWREAGPPKWFARDDAFDARVRATYLSAQEAAANGDLDGWSVTAEGALALLILLDQFPRNMFRGTPRAFATDTRALSIARAAIAAGHDRRFENPLRRFFYLPMMHAETLAEQEACIALCRAAGDAEGEQFAIVHRDIIARFGRFPHRNAILGRRSSPDELAFLDGGGFSG